METLRKANKRKRHPNARGSASLSKSSISRILGPPSARGEYNSVAVVTLRYRGKEYRIEPKGTLEKALRGWKTKESTSGTSRTSKGSIASPQTLKRKWMMSPSLTS